MTKELLISSSPHETKVAVLEDDQLVEVYFQRDVDSSLVGAIYKGRVNRVLPGMQSAFVDVGLERDAFLYVSDFFEESEEYDRVFTDAENRVARMGEGGAGLPGSLAAEAPPTESSAEAPPPVEVSQAAALPAAASPPADATPEPASPQAGATETPAAPAPAKEEFRQREFQRREIPGRRHRRRGRSFRDGRPGFHREPGARPAESRNQGLSQPLEPLPGESLARYSPPAAESLGSPVEPAVFGIDADRIPHPATAAQDAWEQAPHLHTETEGREASESFPAATDLDVTHHPAMAENIEEVREELRAQASDKRADAAETAAAASVVEEAAHDEGDFDLSTAEEEQLLERTDVGVADQPGGEDALEEPAEEPGQDLQAPAESVGPVGEETGTPPSVGQDEVAAEASAPQSQSGAAEPQSYAAYTVRDSQQQPHLLPRHGRRGTRGRFRGSRGRRPETQTPRAGNHQPLPISELLKEGQEILVQIAKEPLGAKGARITSHIALPGRYLVYMPTITHIGVSRKIGSEEERLRLRNIILDNRGSLTGGFIVRTAGAGRSEEELKADLAFLTNLWNEIRGRAERSRAPALLHRDLTLVERILRDLLSPEFKTVRIDNEVEYEHVLDFVNRFQPALIGHVKLYTRETPLFEEFGVQAEIDKALKPKVWLKSGGYIVINQTEALVAIDVNTGKFVGKTNRLEDTIVKTNIDAVMEIVRQIRLRDLGGIIVIDFIDMDERRNRAKVVQALEDALRRDRAPAKILAFNEFGLVALTRKRAKQSLERTLCEPCPYCTGAGWVKSVATVSNEIVAEARKMAAQIDGRVMTLRVNPQVAAILKSRGGARVSEMEASSGKEIVIKSDSSVPQERFEIF